MASYYNYTIGIKREFFPGWVKYKNVVSHKIEPAGNVAYLVINFTDGTVETVPEIGSKTMKVYADYAAQKASNEQYEKDVQQMGEVIASEKVARIQQAAQAAQHRHMAAVGASGPVGGGLPQVPIR